MGKTIGLQKQEKKKNILWYHEMRRRGERFRRALEERNGEEG